MGNRQSDRKKSTKKNQNNNHQSESDQNSQIIKQNEPEFYEGPITLIPDFPNEVSIDEIRMRKYSNIAKVKFQETMKNQRVVPDNRDYLYDTRDFLISKFDLYMMLKMVFVREAIPMDVLSNVYSFYLSFSSTNIVDISAGRFHCLVLTKDNNLFGIFDFGGSGVFLFFIIV